ncbi:MAG: DUF86 domain-containing protein [Chloroflexota bacterium]
MSKDPRVNLAQILACSEKITRYTGAGRERFLQDEMVQDAVIRNLEVIGEAAKREDHAFRSAHPEIPWRAWAGLRDVLIHQEEGLDLERVWTTVEAELPPLHGAVARLLPALSQLEQELAENEEPVERE